MQDITLVDVKTPDGWVDDVTDGKLDAIATSQPYAFAARDRLGNNTVVWSAQSSEPREKEIYRYFSFFQPEMKGRTDAYAGSYPLCQRSTVTGLTGWTVSLNSLKILS